MTEVKMGHSPVIEAEIEGEESPMDLLTALRYAANNEGTQIRRLSWPEDKKCYAYFKDQMLMIENKGEHGFQIHATDLIDDDWVIVK